MKSSPDTGRQTESPTPVAVGVTAASRPLVRDSIRTAGRARPPGALMPGRLLGESPAPGTLEPVRRTASPSRASRPGTNDDSAREKTA
ncbi:hypothetical protein GCM10018952_65100 [Streptosporangium vulgare]